jgi:CheY-like chemotaxis protein
MRRSRLPPLVVVAEDDDDIRDAICSALEGDGFRVHAVSDGELLADYLLTCRARGHLPDVVVTDFRMPGLSGLDVLEAMRVSMIATPVVILTAFASEVQPIATALGAEAVLGKPFEIDELCTAVISAVGW